MPTQYLRVPVDCETELEEEAEYRHAMDGEVYLFDDRVLCQAQAHHVTKGLSPTLIVTPKKEPEVSETYTIPVEVPKKVYEKYSGGSWKVPRKGESFITNDDCSVMQTDNGTWAQHRLVLTPRFTYPPELRSPKVWGIAIDEDGDGYVFSEEPLESGGCWQGHCPLRFVDAQLLFPNIQLPTLSDAGGNWREARWMNPDYGKGE